MVSVDGQMIWANDEHRVFYAASLIKLPLAVAVLRKVDRGECHLDTLIRVRPTISPLSNSLIVIDADSVDPLLDMERTSSRTSNVAVAGLVERSIIVSSNEACNLLLEEVGFDAVNSVLADVGARESMVARHLFDVTVSSVTQRNVASAADYATLLATVLRGDLLSPTSTAYLRALLLAQQDRVAIPAGTPNVGLTNGVIGAVVGNKTGSTSTVGHDVAFVEPTDAAPYCLAVLTSGRPLEDPVVSSAIASIASRAYELRRSVDG